MVGDAAPCAMAAATVLSEAASQPARSTKVSVAELVSLKHPLEPTPLPAAPPPAPPPPPPPPPPPRGVIMGDAWKEAPGEGSMPAEAEVGSISSGSSIWCRGDGGEVGRSGGRESGVGVGIGVGAGGLGLGSGSVAGSGSGVGSESGSG